MVKPHRPTGKRRLLARILEHCGVFSVLKQFGPSFLVIFNYHRIARRGDAISQFDDSLFTTDVDGLLYDIKCMKEFGDPVSEAELVSHVTRGTKLPRRGFMLTFDDGYRDSFDLALPILRDAGIPAIFFVPTEAITSRQLGWWDHVSWYLKQSTKRQIELRGVHYVIPENVAALAHVFTEKIKTQPYSQNNSLLDELRAACGAPPLPEALADAELATWDQLRIAARAGISIGSHTHSHRVLATLDAETQKQELVLSRQLIEREIGKKTFSLAYPAGGYEHFNRETMSLVEDAGYALAFSYRTGANFAGHIAPYDVKRIDRQSDRASFHAAFSAPSVFARCESRLSKPRLKVRTL